jgi:hypothetical protein
MVTLGRRRNTQRLLTVTLRLDAIVDKQRRLSDGDSVSLHAQEDAHCGADREGDKHQVEKPQNTHFLFPSCCRWFVMMVVGDGEGEAEDGVEVEVEVEDGSSKT